MNSSGRRSAVSIGPAAVERVAERVDDAAEERFPDRHRRDLPGAADRLALLDLLPLADERRADVVLFEVEREAGDAVLEVEHLERDAVLEAVDARDPVADLEHGADLGEIGLDVVLLDPLLQDRGDLFGSELHVVSLVIEIRKRETWAGGAGLCPAGAVATAKGELRRRRGLMGEPRVPPCCLSFTWSPSSS